MVTINPSSITDLLALKAAGAPVTLTSHPGNASLYKLSLWRCGIPEHFWDVTCCVADANNWPMFRLKNGEAELLVNEQTYRTIKQETRVVRRFVTAYQAAKSGERLGRAHVRACEQAFPGALSSCSRLLLSESGKVREMFEYLAETAPQVFGRFITSAGVMVPIEESGLRRQDYAASFMNVLGELDHLLFSDEPLETRGGACYDGVMVPLSSMLVQYWQTGRIDRYDISGPDMINYASTREHQERLAQMLRHLRAWDKALVPETLIVRLFPGTAACVGHIPGHVSESVMYRKVGALREQQLSGEAKRAKWEAAKEDERLWPLQVKPSVDRYFSQHDLLEHGGRLEVDEFWKDIPLERLWETLTRANALLRIK